MTEPQISSSKSTPFWRGTLVLALVAAVFTAIYKAMDNITVHNIITTDDGLTAAFAYLVLGAWTGVFFGFFFARTLGKRLIDRDYEGVVVKNAFMQSRAFVAGAISAGSTLFLLWGNQFGDPSVLIALGSGVILYTTIYDVATKEVAIHRILVPAMLVFCGGILASYGGTVNVTLAGLLLVLLLSNGLTALSEIVEQKGVKRSDGVNFFLWRFFWLAVTGTIIALTLSSIRGYLAELLQTIQKALPYIPWIALTMFFVFLGIGLKLVAKKQGAVSVVLIALSAQIILGYPITVVGNWLSPGLFGFIPSDYLIWGARLLGAALIIGAIYLLRARTTETKVLPEPESVNASSGTPTPQ